MFNCSLAASESEPDFLGPRSALFWLFSSLRGSSCTYSSMVFVSAKRSMTSPFCWNVPWVLSRTAHTEAVPASAAAQHRESRMLGVVTSLHVRCDVPTQDVPSLAF